MNKGFLQTSIPPNWKTINISSAKEDMQLALDIAKENLDKIKSLKDNGEPLTYLNTVRAFDRATDTLNRAWGYINHLQSVDDNDSLRDIINELTPIVTDFYSSLSLDSNIYNIIKEFSQTDEGKSLTGDKKRLTDETILDFQDSGADLPDDKKLRLKEIDTLLALKTQKFSENVLDSTKQFTLLIENQADVEGVPPTALAVAKQKATQKNKQGWLFTLEQPSYVPFMTYAKNDALREKMWRAFSAVATTGEFSNWELLKEILVLRDENAKILSKNNFADLVLSRRMAKNGKTAIDFVDSLTQKFEKHFQVEKQEIIDFAKENGYLNDDEIMPPWRFGYVAEKLRLSRYGFDPEQLRKYFPLESVMNGMFDICQTLYGLKIKKSPQTTNAWHDSVSLYEVSDADGSTIGLFYADFFPRDQKRAGAWMNLLSPKTDDSPALGLIAGNVTEKTDDTPALLTIDEVETLFHEFGHLIHFFMMDSPEIGLREVAWDFVELPSQIMENWCHFKNCLDLFAADWKTGELLPDCLFQKFDSASKFMGAISSMRQLSFAKIDLFMHINAKLFIDSDNIETLAKSVLEKYSLNLSEDSPSILPRFTHLFGDSVGYAAGYYSYKWAEVLDADAFTKFEKLGILNSNVGKEFANKILKVGSSVSADIAFKNFMGRDPDLDALVKRSI